MRRLNSATVLPGREMTPSRFIWQFAFVNLLVFNWPLWLHLHKQVPIHSSLGLGVVAVLAGLSVALSWLVLGTVSLLSPRAMWPLIWFWVLANAVALYAMQTYSVVLDKTMMGNVWQTHGEEAWGLFHPLLLLYVALALVALVWLWRGLRWGAEHRIRRLLHLLAGLVLSLATVFSQSAAWLWVDQNAKVVGGLLLPWSYVVNSLRHWQEHLESQKVLPYLPALVWDPAPSDAPAAVTVVLVIGESARSANFALYGYARQTNPQLSQSPVLVMPDAQSCATYTRRALECLLAHDPQSGSLTHESLPDYLARSGGVEVIWRTRNWGEPRLRNVRPQRGPELSELCRQRQCPHPDQDETLLFDLDSLLAQTSSDRQLIVLHQSGSHGPAYHSKYPNSFGRFEPVCTSVDLKQCSPGSLVNAYDNTLLYTDALLGQIIQVLGQQSKRRTVLIYISDHGESLGEGGWYLHGAPDVVAPVEQKAIPFLIWLSANHAPLLAPQAGVPKWPVHQPMMAPAPRRAPYGQGHVFHTVLGALGARSAVYQSDYDVLTPWRANRD